MEVQGSGIEVATYFASVPFKDRAQSERRLAALLEGRHDNLGENLLAGLEEAAEPDRVLVSLERFLEAATGPLTHLGLMAEAPRYARMLTSIFDQSQFLTEIVCRNPAYTLWLWEDADLVRAVPAEEMWAELRDQLAAFNDFRAQCQSMRRFKRREILRIGVRDIYTHASLASITEDLSNLADAALEAAVAISAQDLAPRFGKPLNADGSDAAFAVIAMGKLGGRELNFSSDIDLLFVYSEEGETSGEGGKSVTNAEYYQKLGERVISAISEQTEEGRVFRVDMRLRPFGRMGALAVSLGNCIDYYEHFGRAWERQALIKARTAAGDQALGNRFIEATRPFVFPRYFDDETLEDIRETKRQMEAQIAERGETEIEVKLGRGGIRDIEFTVQILQLLNGGKVPGLRTRNSLEAIRILGQEQLLSPFEAEELSSNYVFLRQVEHRLQIEMSQQVHILPSSPEALDVFARRLGYRSGESFMSVYRDKAEATRRILDRFLEVEGSGNLWISDLLNRASDGAVGKERLAALGFRDTERARGEFLLLCNGPVERPHRLHVRQQFYSIAPALVRSLAHSTRPDDNLLRLSQVLSGLRVPGPIYEMLRMRPELCDLLVKVVANSEFLSDILIREPDVFDFFSSPAALENPSTREQLELELDSLEKAIDSAAAPYRLHDGELLRVGLRDLLLGTDVVEIGRELSLLAEIILDYAVRKARAAVEERFGKAEAAFGVLTLGKLGGCEMGYGSDLDLLFVFDSEGAVPDARSHIEYFTAVAAKTIGILKESTRYGRLYDIDARLRPEGKKGMLTVPGTRLPEYYRKQAQAWERLALMKVRAVGGDAAFAERVEKECSEIAFTTLPSAADLDQIESIRQKLVQESTPFNLKKFEGGLAELEFGLRLCQWRYAQQCPEVRRADVVGALQALTAAGKLAPAEADQLREAYVLYRRIENRIRIRHGRSETAHLPEDPEERADLATRLGLEGDPLELLKAKRVHVHGFYRRAFESLRALAGG